MDPLFQDTYAQKMVAREMPSGNRTLSLAPLAGGLLGLLTGLVIGISDLLGIGAPDRSG